ncbi:MAG: hypothetical protein ACLVFI_00945 [Christensenellales bacterium]
MILATRRRFSLALAIELEKTLKETYGISSKLTRNSGTITIDGYEDRQLDSSHISLRGELAKDCDLFVSLHTNANLENAGGSPTEQQPISINKPIIFVNSVALDNPTALRIANEVGSRLAAASFDQGLSETKAFREAQKQEVLEWTDAYNDSRDKEGTVCKRTGTRGITMVFCAELLTYRFPVSSLNTDFILCRRFVRLLLKGT